ncbi:MULTISPECIES: LysR substrate-binding domain-containing protein [Providencia]|uniref:LysR substrate-binding domain-containing protein n=3 Tax=Providencia TaxID=586 RepID=A0AA42FJ72_9GAMM|nr:MULTISPECIES: LysR substrate-binding domain-containing protein [Providencia]APC11531.1 HTH-type transcriptional regulator YjiE [Providencia rettgeri]AVL74881.1 LysR family transcriptional regulator [Providencia rettgeri]EIU7558546.1 LysR family transcriptional regulator [Providencia rettgeri]EJD6041725.1 LysR family transcriptional regulator [Providencia rettgeri]EJD6371149.1 LysR family transcriptional regulator [Providencia rettgeri]
MISNLEIKWLHDIVVLEECRSFTLAAEKRNISQSSFSRRIQSIESSVGFEIFDRNTNPLQLTTQGKSFIVYARNLLDDIYFQINRIKGIDNDKQKINISAAHSLSVFLLPDFISQFSKNVDKIFFVESINVDEAVHKLKEGQSDFILSFYNEELMSSPFLHTKILESRLHLVSPCDEKKRPIFNIDSSTLPLMKYTDESYMGRQVNQLINKSDNLPFELSFVSSMSDVLKRMILTGSGVGWLPDYSIKNELEKNELAILDPKLSVTMGVYIYRTEARLNISSERFWQFMRNQTAQ